MRTPVPCIWDRGFFDLTILKSMKPYKEIIQSGLKERGLEIDTLLDLETELPWWIEERWIVKRGFDSLELHVIFLTDRGWESGTKIVWEVAFTEKVMTSYTDDTSKIASLDLMKGTFSKKIYQLWRELDSYIAMQK
jgi:hypothetical protein